MTERIIKISNLVVNMENYRFEPQGSQRDAIIKMVTELGDKIYNLAVDILQNGLNPMESLMVIPSPENDKQYVVLEGNRRVCALKLTDNPSLLPDEFSSLRKRFIKLNHDNLDHLVKEVRCIMTDTIEDADLWIKRKHYGEQDGVGTVTWDAQQKQRFAERVEGIQADSMQVITFLSQSEYVPIEVKSQLKDVKITSLDRLLSDSYVREFLGVYKEDGRLLSHLKEVELVKGLLHIVRDLLDPSFKVSRIYTKDLRKTYIDEINTEDVPILSEEAETVWTIAKTEENTQLEQEQTKRERKPRTRKPKVIIRTLIPKELEIPIDNPKIYAIFDELKKMPIDSFPQSVSVMLRVFLELSVDEFIDTYNIQYGAAKTACESSESLENKVRRVSNYMQMRKLISKDQYKGIHVEMKDRDSILSVDTLNAFVHNKSVSPKADNLITGWNNIQVFFEKLWMAISEKNI